ncbi:hypothetical protein WJX73_006283 [Symbiochloris irregularis]|uniref:Succinyl-CoA:3-ketoacid-coenzyme A transferase n=1 Tax=Symbiochloris irregularis TaxID=706552 RepID=A0AAW1PD43_9CHLO
MASARRLRVLEHHLTNAKAPAGSDTHIHKVTSAEEAVQCIRDGSVITVAGFVGTGLPEALVNAVRARFDASGHPCNLHLYAVAAVGDGKGRGMCKLAVEGLVTKFTYGWAGLSPAYAKLIQQGKIAAWNLPLGVVSHLFREVAAKRPGPITPVGLATFVDPREQGGKVTSPQQPDAVQLISVGGRELLWYPSPASVDVAILRGTTADLDGNISFEREPFYADQLYQAMAVHNSGGTVLVQVLRVVQRGCIPSRLVHLPGCFVDKVVIAPPELHWQSLATPAHEGWLCGEMYAHSQQSPDMDLSERRIIAHRALLEIRASNAIINLGVGMPEGVARMVATHARRDNPGCLPVTLTTEVGVVGGFPAGGLRFGAAANPAAVMPCASMIDFYQGGGADTACLGMGEVDEHGNVNVSRFEGRMPGCGGFIDISSTAKQVLFLGTFTSGGLKISVRGGKLHIEREGRIRKFRRKVLEKTFAAASSRGRPIRYITERAVFQLTEGTSGTLELLEIAPGVDLQKDILEEMDFRPLTKAVKIMDTRCFAL